MLTILTNYYQVKLIKNLSEHKTLFLWLALLWTAIVTFFCLVNFNRLPQVSIANFDKVGHLVFHFGITFFWFLYFKLQQSNTDSKALLRAFLISFFYGITIEILQGLFTDTREGDFYDVLANMTGSLIAVALVLIVIKFTRKSNK